MKLFIGVAWVDNIVLLWGKSVFPGFLPFYLNLGYLLSTYVHTLIMSVVV